MMNNTNTPTKKHGTATLWSIESIITEIQEIADAGLNGAIYRVNEHGERIAISKEDILDLILDQTTLALMDIEDLKHQIEALAIHHEAKTERDYLTLPVVDLGGAQ
ncbi:hypothetical protein [Aggregatibacter sp.]